MKRLFWMLLAIGALGLVLGGACSKEEGGEEGASEETAGGSEEGAGDEGAGEQPAEGGEVEAEEEEGDEASGGDAMTGIEACDSLIKRALECDELPPATLEAYKKAAEGWKQAVQAGGEEARSTIEQSCEQAEGAWKQAFDNVGC